MNIFVALLPLLIIGIIGFTFWVVFKNGVIKLGFFKNKVVVKFLVLTYAAILLISVIFGELVLKGNANVLVIDDKSYEETTLLDDAIYNGHVDELDPIYIQDEWEYEYSGKELNIRLMEGNPEEWIRVERKVENDGIIEGKYISSTIMDSINLSKEIKPTKVELKQDTLFLHGNDPVTLKYAQFQKEFVISQFTGRGFMESSFSSSDTRVLYLKIPKDLKLIHSDVLFIDYVEEE